MYRINNLLKHQNTNSTLLMSGGGRKKYIELCKQISYNALKELCETNKIDKTNKNTKIDFKQNESEFSLCYSNYKDKVRISNDVNNTITFFFNGLIHSHPRTNNAIFNIKTEIDELKIKIKI